jgi:hypothetical protein
MGLTAVMFLGQRFFWTAVTFWDSGQVFWDSGQVFRDSGQVFRDSGHVDSAFDWWFFAWFSTVEYMGFFFGVRTDIG